MKLALERVAKYQRFVENIEIPGVKGAVPYYFQIRSWCYKLCQDLHLIIGVTVFISNWGYILRTLRPELLTYYSITDNVRRGGKTLDQAAHNAGVMLFSPPPITIRHFAGATSQAGTILIYMYHFMKKYDGSVQRTALEIRYFQTPGQSVPSLIVAAALTDNRRGENTDKITFDEYHLADPALFSAVVLGMTMLKHVTLSIFSTRKHTDMKGLEDYADLHKDVRDPRVLRHTTQGVCQWCASNIPPAKHIFCYHTSHQGGNNSKDRKAETIRQMITSMGIDSTLYAQEGNNMMFENAIKVCQPEDVKRALTPLSLESLKSLSPAYRIDIGIDPNGGGMDNLGITALLHRVNGDVEVSARYTHVFNLFSFFCGGEVHIGIKSDKLDGVCCQNRRCLKLLAKGDRLVDLGLVVHVVCLQCLEGV